MGTKPEKKRGNELHRQISIEFIQSSACFAVRTPHAQKDPGIVGWDPVTNSKEKSRETIETVKKTNDNIGIHLFGRTVDVDVDTDNALLFEALDHFLPATPHVFGRGDRRRTHRLYELSDLEGDFDPKEWPFLKKIEERLEIKMEVRGGRGRDGKYTLLPGSVHPSGDCYEWDDLKQARTTPISVPQKRLLYSIQNALITTLLAPHWVEGRRNQLCMALSGFLYRASKHSETINDGSLDQSRCREIIEGLMVVADDDPSDYAMRIKTFEKTWDKAEQKQPVSGAKMISEIMGDPSIISLLYSILVQSGDLKELDELFEQYVFVANSAAVIDLKAPLDTNYMMGPQAFEATMKGRYLSLPGSERVKIYDLLSSSMQRTMVQRISVDPTKDRVFVDDEGLSCANMWDGWAIPPCDGKVEDDEVAIFTDYLFRVVCKSRKEEYDWVVQWIAHIFQKPDDKPGTALVLVGSQGAGKSMLGEKILRPIIGKSHSSKVGTVEKLTSKFNAHMAGKLLIMGEEVINSNRRNDANALKDAITSTSRQIERKGIDAIEMDDFARYLFTSNSVDNAVAVEKGDRRYTILHVADDYAHEGTKPREEKLEFWGRLYDYLETTREGRILPHEENMSKLHRWFLQQEVDPKQVRTVINTEAKSRVAMRSARGIDQMLLQIVTLDSPFDLLHERDRVMGMGAKRKGTNGGFEFTEEWPDRVKSEILGAIYNKAQGRDVFESRASFEVAATLKTLGLIENASTKPVRVGQATPKMVEFPQREKIVEYLRTVLGYDMPDYEEDEDEAHAPEQDHSNTADF